MVMFSGLKGGKLLGFWERVPEVVVDPGSL